LKKTLKEFRKIKHLSQQELSDRSGISVRTIQRIEKNLSKGSPYIIKSICKALQIEIDDIELSSVLPENHETHSGNEVESIDATTCENNNYTRQLKLINTSSMLVLLFPLLNLLIPFILYWKTRKSANNKIVALKILSFQLLWTIFTLLLMLFIPAISQVFFGMHEISGYPLFFWIYLLSVVLNILITIDTGIRLNKSERVLTFIPNML